MDFTKIATISPNVLFQEVSGEMVILDLTGEQYLGLDHVGTRVWQLIEEDNGFSLHSIYEQLLEEYDVSPNELKEDLKILVATMLKEKIVTLNDKAESYEIDL